MYIYLSRYNRYVLSSLLLVLFLLSITSLAISVSNISSGAGPSYGVYVNGEVYFVAQSANELQVIKGDSIVQTYPLPHFGKAVPFKIAYGDGYFFIAYEKGPFIQLNSKLHDVNNYTINEIGNYPDIIYAGNYAIVTASYGNSVYFISPSGKITEVTVMSSPQALAYDNYTNIVYVGAYSNNSIYGISLSSLSVIKKFTINDSTIESMAFVPPDILAVATYDQQVEFINLTNDKIIHTVTFTGGINGYSQIIYANGFLYLSLAHQNDQVAVMNTSGALIDLVTVGNGPNGIVYDPSDNDIYVMAYSSNQVNYFTALTPSVPHTTVHVSTINYPLIAGIAVVVLVIIGIVVFIRRR
ncbi:YncE family protein [Acidianus manzaensis]|uniref:YncE family protein n=1 Tax=Acidianus manzaensis TaxID=282676 RepID=A0A1W6K2N0_9CREN|nr:hypothetical protein [Acidianus manzaensis]ARM76793.1 hypothetical protein B6F84_12710 [Acidianus manzaensis]